MVHMTRAVTLRLAVILWCGVTGCAGPLDEEDPGSAEMKSLGAVTELTDIYPVEVTEHYELGDTEAGATVLNAVAYARYAAELNGDPGVGASEDPVRIAEVLRDQAQWSGVAYDDAVRYAQILAPDHAHEDYLSELAADARRLAGADRLSRQGKGIVDGAARVNACVADGYDPVACCTALAWVEALRGVERHGEGYGAATRRILAARQAALQSGESATIQPFSQAGVRAWLSYCSGDVTQAPSSVAGFKARFGDYHSDTAVWVSELHPLSPAKQAGRRIYRRRLTDGTLVSVAESLSDDCSVRETETIVARSGRQAQFWAFDRLGRRVTHAYFPTRRPGEDAARFVPNACMGCHYTMDTRRFTVPMPSFEALNLKLFQDRGAPVWRDHRDCTHPNEPLILHDTATIGR